MAFVKNALADLSGGRRGILRVFRPAATAAFSRLDILRPGYAEACGIVSELGFEPAPRPAGGHLAVYDGASVVVDLVAPTAGAHSDPMARFGFFAGLIRKAGRHLGVNLNIGSLPDEYCLGKYSLNGNGRKVAGLGQRITRHGFHLGAVMMVGPAHQPREAMAAAYPALNLPLDPATVGSLSDISPGISCADATAIILSEIRGIADIRQAVSPRPGGKTVNVPPSSL